MCVTMYMYLNFVILYEFLYNEFAYQPLQQSTYYVIFIRVFLSTFATKYVYG
jgi:hypothetical protein